MFEAVYSPYLVAAGTLRMLRSIGRTPASACVLRWITQHLDLDLENVGPHRSVDTRVFRGNHRGRG